MLLSSFEPLKALRGKIAARISDVMFRRALVVVQFTFSVVLITGTIIVGKQLTFLRFATGQLQQGACIVYEHEQYGRAFRGGESFPARKILL